MENILIAFTILSGVIFGGIAGYITNKFAISHLFKDIKIFIKKPLKAVITKNQKDLAKNLSKLVTRKLITFEKMINSLKKNKITFMEIVNKSINKILDKANKSNISKESIDDIDKTGNIEMALKRTSGDIINNSLNNFIDKLSENICVCKITDKNTLDDIISKLIGTFAQCIILNDGLGDYIDKFIYNNKNSSIADFLGKDNCEVIKKNLGKKTDKILDDLFLNGKNEFVLKNIDILIKETEIEKHLKSISQKILKRKIKDLFENEINSYSFSEEMIEIVKNVFSSGDFKVILIELVKVIYNELYSSNLKINDIFPEEFWNKIEEIIVENDSLINSIIDTLRELVKNNEEQIILNIEYAVDKTIDNNSAGSVSNLLRDIFRDNIINFIKGKIDDEYKIISSLYKILLNSETNDGIKKQFSKFLNSEDFKSKKISELVKKFNINDINKLVNILINFINDILNDSANNNEFIKYIINFIGELELSVFISSNKFNEFIDNKIKKIPDLLENDSIGNALHKFLKNTINKYINDLFNKKIGCIFNDFNTKNKNLDKSLNEFICGASVKIKDLLIEYLYDKSIDEIVQPVLDNSRSKTIKTFFYNMSIKYIDKLKKLKFKTILDNIIGNKKLTPKIIEISLKPMLEKLSIEGMVEKGVNNMNSADLCDKVQDFFGKELKPLTKIGAILGAAVGGITAGLFLFIGKLSWHDLLWGSSGWSILISIIIYAFIGVITNAMAIHYLFKPYEKKTGFLREKFKLQQGYICRDENKKNCAEGISFFIKENFLNGKAIDSNDLQSKTEKFFNETIPQNNFSKLRDNLVNNSEKISNFLIDKVDTNSSELSEYITKILINYAENSNLREIADKIGFNKISDGIINIIISKENYISDKIYEFFSKSSDKTSKYINSDLFTPYLSKKIIEYVIESVITESTIKNIVLKYQSNFDKIKHKKIGDIFDISKINFSNTNISNIKEKFKDFIMKKAKDSINNDSKNAETIGTLFDGKICDVLEHFINKLPGFIKENFIDNFKKPEIIKKFSDGIFQLMSKNENFWESIVFWSIGKDELIYSTVSILMTEKLDDMWNDNINFIEKKINNIFKEYIYPIRISAIVDRIDLKNINSFTDNLFYKNNIKIQYNISKVLKKAFNIISRKECIVFIKIFNIYKLENIYNRFEREINDLIKNVNLSFDKNKKEIICFTKEILDIIFKEYYLDYSIKDYFYNVNEYKFKDSTVEILELVLNDEAVKSYILDCINYIPKNSILYYINEKEISNSVNSFMEYVIEDDLIKEELLKSLDSIINVICEDEYNLFSSKSFKYIYDELTKILFSDTVKNINFGELLSCFDFNELMYTSIISLTGEELHNLFNSFAKEYFTKLKLWGVTGFFFGVNNIFSIMFLIVYAIFIRKEL